MNTDLLKERIFKLFREPRSVQRYAARRLLFRPLELLGFHIVADHFYEPIPNLKSIRENVDKRLDIPGHDFEDSRLLDENRQRLARYSAEFVKFTNSFGYKKNNYYFNRCDALHLYCLIRELKFQSIIEVGQGFSSRVILAALEANSQETGGRDVKFTSIDPYDRITSQGGLSERIRFQVVRQKIQSLGQEGLFSLIGPETLLFLDSSHVYKRGSDVEFYFQAILPFVPQGTYVHLHDIFLPWTWPLSFLVKRKWFWNEHDFLYAYLCHNMKYELILPVYHLTKTQEEVRQNLRSTFGEDVSAGSSIYLRSRNG